MPAFREINGGDWCLRRASVLETSNHGGFAMLYCITANYTPKALEAMAKTPNTNRQEAFEKLVTAGGGKLVAMYGTMVDGPGAIAIMDVERIVAPAIAAVVASSDGVHNVRAYRLYTMEEVIAIRQKRVQLQASYTPPGH
jgi:uncharacterized protein with GYD domain